MTAPARVLGLDGKSYPSRPLPAADQEQLVGHVHYLAHAERLSIRQIQASLEREHGVRRSVGWISGVLRDWRCDHCSGGSNVTT